MGKDDHSPFIKVTGRGATGGPAENVVIAGTPPLPLHH